MTSNSQQKIIDEVESKMEIVPYTKRDRLITTSILIIVAANLLIMITTLLVWGNLS